MNGGPINHFTKRISAGGWWASRRYFVHAASGSIFSYINNPDGTGYNVNIGILVKLIDYSHDMKRNLGQYVGQVYVVTSSGNNWYYPKKLKPVR